MFAKYEFRSDVVAATYIHTIQHTDSSISYPPLGCKDRCGVLRYCCCFITAWVVTSFALVVIPCLCRQVEGRAGVAKLEACLQSLPPTAFRFVVVTSSEGVEGELGAVVDSRLWTDLPECTIVVVAASEVCYGVFFYSTRWFSGIRYRRVFSACCPLWTTLI